MKSGQKRYYAHQQKSLLIVFSGDQQKLINTKTGQTTAITGQVDMDEYSEI